MIDKATGCTVIDKATGAIIASSSFLSFAKRQERIVFGADLYGHVGEGNTGDEEIIGRNGAGTRNKEGSMVVDFAKRIDLAIVKNYFKKKGEHRATYKSGRKSTQIDYVKCRRRNLKEMCDCKVMMNECVAKQHVW